MKLRDFWSFHYDSLKRKKIAYRRREAKAIINTKAIRQIITATKIPVLTPAEGGCKSEFVGVGKTAVVGVGRGLYLGVGTGVEIGLFPCGSGPVFTVGFGVGVGETVIQVNVIVPGEETVKEATFKLES